MGLQVFSFSLSLQTSRYMALAGAVFFLSILFCARLWKTRFVAVLYPFAHFRPISPSDVLPLLLFGCVFYPCVLFWSFPFLCPPPFLPFMGVSVMCCLSHFCCCPTWGFLLCKPTHYI
eukprot:jgi/Botrbrau1/6267/Bobra.0129s0015.1